MIVDSLIAHGFRVKNDIPVACDGIGFVNLLRAGKDWLENHIAVVNGLNVFPVPDGDTGTNMLLTMRSAVDAAEQTTGHHAGKIALSAAHGALMGARGNSGVILSQFLQGLANGLRDQETCTATDFACATHLAAELAYQSVMEPVEGTILTVARAIAEAAHQYAAANDDLIGQFEVIVDAAAIAQASTPDLLPILKEAGVTDSGGQGLLYIMEGWLRFLTQQPINFDPSENIVPELHSQLGVDRKEYGYDVQFLISGENLDLSEIRQKINALGWSTVVVGDAQLVKVHIHADDPGLPLSYGASLGSLSDVVVEDLSEQAKNFVYQHSVTAGPVVSSPASAIATVAIVPGEGLTDIFQSLGVTRVVSGGQSMNPSVKDVLQAVEEIDADQILILPNNSNIMLMAEQIQRLATRPVHVVSSNTIPQGVAALLAFNLNLDAADNAARMSAAAEQVVTIEITQAVRKISYNGLRVESGAVIGLLDGNLVSTGEDSNIVALEVLARLNIDDFEIITIYYGSSEEPERASGLAQLIETSYPNLEVELYSGGQPHYTYIISAE
jgi:DAK2 domain fusion protein YloV